MADKNKKNATARALELLDRAHALAEGDGTFEAMYDAAAALFFLTPDGHLLDSGLEAASLDAAIARHVDRLGALSEGERGARTLELATVIFTGSSTANAVNGNAAAEKLLSCSFPCGLDDLDLDPVSLRAIQALTGPGGSTTDVTLLRKSDKQRIHGRTRALDDGRSHLLTLAFLDWTRERVAQLSAKFGLSPSESAVFSGLLHGKTQAEIAKERGRSVETIKVQAKAILKKTGTSRVVELVQLAIGLALLDARGAEADSAAPDAVLMSAPKSDGMLAPRRANGFDHERSLGVLEAGRVGGAPVLFVHGLPFGPFLSPGMDAQLSQAGLHLVAASRPGFGLSDAAPRNADYKVQSVEDALALADRTWPARTRRPIVVLAHQAGATHASRIAKALGDDAKALLIVGAGPPIKAQHLTRMPRHIRVAAAASRHAPKVMEMILRLGVPVWRRRGPEAYLRHLFADSPVDLAALDDPAGRTALKAGILHMVEQGAQAFVFEGAATTADWTEDYRAVPCPVHWLCGAQSAVTSPDDVKAFTNAEGCASLAVVPGAGSTILVTHFATVVEKLTELARFNPLGE